jgi:argininosuccinate lyase
MPQKKNPDIGELARGKAGRLIGHVAGILAMLKGLPLAYDRDLQEDKEPVFDAVDTLSVVLPAVTGMIATMTVRADRLAAAAPAGFTLATEVAEWLVRRGVPFREAHEVTGRLVVHCLARGCELDQVSDAELAVLSDHLTPEVRDVLSVSGALAARTTYGSTGPRPMAEQLATVNHRLATWREWAVAPVLPGR